ncbi:cytochrome P450 family 71 subfamily B polypeptide 23 [Euphorbia peplus]|nr:putative cytochrome P450 monooxygenase [Euphorbia peplus]WCJ37100.1 cytochrome P450 family 71 subfamily B polypeptide 23 [Euphorbia peplus]
MELQIPSFPIFVCFLLFTVTFLRIRRKKQTQDCNFPPGPMQFPIIGNIPQLLGGLFHHRLADLAKIHGPIMSIQQGQIPAVVITSVELAKEVLKVQGEEFAGRPHAPAGDVLYYDCKDIVFAPYGDHWRQMRKICTLEFLSLKRVQSFRAVREENISGFIKFLDTKVFLSVNLTKTIGDLTSAIMLIKTYGKCEEKLLALLEKVKQAVLDTSSGTDLFPSLRFLQYINGEKSRMARVQKEMDEMLDEILKDHKIKHKFGDNNLLQVLLDLQQNGDLELPLTNEVIKANIMEIFFGGSHTSSKTVEWAMSELMRNPESMRKVQAEVRQVFGKKGNVEESRMQELKYLKSVVKETLRLHPPATFVTRECRLKSKVNGYDIYPKTVVHVNIYAISRDPSVWTEPEKFYPERFEDNQIDYKGANMELIPFGAGKRICPGISLATTYVELLLANLLYHFDWKFPDGITSTNLDMTEIYRGALARKVDLCLIPIPFSKS